MNKDDYEYLKQLPNLGVKLISILDINKVWYAPDDTVIRVAHILNRNNIFDNTLSSIQYFENPNGFSRVLLELIKEYEKEHAEVKPEDEDA